MSFIAGMLVGQLDLVNSFCKQSHGTLLEIGAHMVILAVFKAHILKKSHQLY